MRFPKIRKKFEEDMERLKHKMRKDTVQEEGGPRPC
jgi:hypothetical protein